MSNYIVRSGDTLSAIAARYGLSLGALESANPQISNANAIYVGETVHIPDTFTAAPSGARYTVRAGDSLSSIGAKFGVSYQAIAAANGITNPNKIYAGQVLTIPGARAPAPPPPPRPSGTHYTVQAGDSLSSIGARFGVSYTAIAAANGLANPNMIYPGEVLTIPGANGGGGGGGGTSNPPGWVSGGGTLYGADTSRWQDDATFQASIAGKAWTAIKATEGVGFTDPAFRARWNELGQRIQSGQMKLRVAYTFMHAGDGAGQARFFMDSLGVNGPLPAGTRLALDWEAGALSDPQALRDAANTIHSVTGLWPLIYTSGSEVGRARAAVPNAPIWEAKWGGAIPTDVPFVQYSDSPGYDHDLFNGNINALDKFAGWA